MAEGGGGPATVLEAVLEQTGYLAELVQSPDPQDETRVENLETTVGSIQTDVSEIKVRLTRVEKRRS